MTCGHCADAVTNEISHVAGVTHVTGGTAPVTVRSDALLPESDLAAALAEAGDYHLALN